MSFPARVRALSPLRVLIARALVGYVLVRVLLVAVAAFVAEFAGGDAGASLQSPLGVILIAAAVGEADLRRRREKIFWANLGFPFYTTPALWAAAAALGESLLAVLIA